MLDVIQTEAAIWTQFAVITPGRIGNADKCLRPNHWVGYWQKLAGTGYINLPGNPIAQQAWQARSLCLNSNETQTLMVACQTLVSAPQIRGVATA